MDQNDEQIWLELAELFFLDTEPDKADFDRVTKLLRANGWGRAHTEKVLLEYIAPVAGANLGFGLYPVIGEWAAFEKMNIAMNVRKRIALRTSYPSKYYWILPDWLNRRLLKELDIERLLSQLD